MELLVQAARFMLSAMKPSFDCTVVGSCVVDILCRPVALDKPVGRGVLHESDAAVLAVGGITSNSGITMSRLGLKVAAFSYVGKDSWGPMLRDIYRSEHIDAQALIDHPAAPTSTTIVLIEPSGERSFYHCVGAPRLMDGGAMLSQMDLFARSRYMLLGYYGLMPILEPELPDVFRQIRATGCKTAMDSQGAGGSMQPLDRILPHLDVWVPSLAEARHQTGLDDPRKMIDIYRDCGAPGILGVKLGGKRGVLLSPRKGEYVEIPSCQPPGPVVDTTGAGDSFYAGLLAGLVKGLPLEKAGRLGAGAAACCVASLGGASGGRDYTFTARLAGI